MCVRAMTAAAGGNSLGSHAVLVDLAATAHCGGSSVGARFGFLCGVIGCQRPDGRIVKLAGHPPHVADRVWIATRLGAEGRELGSEIVDVLTCESRELRLRAVAGRPVTGAADGDREVLRSGARRGVGFARERCGPSGD